MPEAILIPTLSLLAVLLVLLVALATRKAAKLYSDALRGELEASNV